MAKYQQPNPYNNLQYWHQMQQHTKKKQEQQSQQGQQLEQQGYVKKKNCNCGGKKKQ